MIIKSMSRKQATFGQLVDYMEDGRQDKKYTLKHNLYSNKTEKIKEEFEENARYIKKRKNGVYMYHEVLSITKSNKITEEQQKERLREIAFKYIEKRSQNNLVYAVLHDDKQDNLHYHFMISSNEVQDTSKHRLSKKEFDNLKKELENQVLKNYPELEQKEIINKKSTAKLSKKGAELKRRTGKTSQRDSVKNRLKTVFNSSEDKQSFFENMTNEKLEVYVRGKNIGVVDKVTGRKHRLQTLGMLDEFNRISSIVEKSETIKERKEEIQEQRKPYKEKIKIKTGTLQKDNKGADNMVEKNTTSQEAHGNINDKEGNIISETVGKVKEFIKGDLTAEEVLEQRKQEMKDERVHKEQTKNESSNSNKR